MRPLTETLREALKGSNDEWATLEVWTPAGNMTPLTFTASNAPVVSIDRTRNPRRTITAVIADQSLTVTDATSLLAPFGNELHAARGCITDAGFETVTSGVFTIETSEMTMTANGWQITLQGSDRSVTVARHQYEQPYVVIPGTQVADAIAYLWRSAIPGIKLRFDPRVNKRLSGMVLGIGDAVDKFADATKLAAFAGAETFADADGAAVLRPIPDPASQDPVWDYSEGPDCLVTDLSSKLDRTTFVNKVTYESTPLSGSGASTAVSATAIDDDKVSPTYYRTFGVQAVKVSTTALNSIGECYQAAAGDLRRRLGKARQLSITAAVNPALEEDDLVTIALAEAGLESEDVAVETMSMPLAGGTMTFTTRAPLPFSASGKRL